jgi:hypothetical protein
MPNPRLIQTAERWMNKEVPIVREKEKVVEPKNQEVSTSVGFPDNVASSFILSYDGPHKDFAQELIAKSNEMFAGTSAEIPSGRTGEVEKMHILKRLGLITALHRNTQLRSTNLYPITPAQSEYLLMREKLTNPSNNWEDLALILYDHSESGENPQEANALYQEISKHRQDFGLSKSDLEKKLIVVNAGIKRADGMPYGVCPIVLPGLTQVYTHEVLDKVGEDLNFEGYGFKGGLPLIKQLEKGDRTLYLPDETENIGLRVLCRYRDLDLDAGDRGLSYADEAGRVSFAPQGLASKK